MGSSENVEMVIMGIDPGLVATGYGVAETLPEGLRVVIAGDIRPPRSAPLPERLAFIHDGLARLVAAHHPDTVVLEQLFTHAHHVTTATLMGHARGIACLVAQEHGLPLAEYPPTHVKKSLTGNGHASKEQVARMVGQWLHHESACRAGREASWSADATDALALAIVHAHTMAQRRNLVITSDQIPSSK